MRQGRRRKPAPMKTVHLHIGLPKTATTLIQNSMFAAPEILGRLDIGYLQFGTDVFGDRGHHILVQGILGKRGKRIRARTTDAEIEAAWPAALAEIEASPAKNIFISSELFSFAIIDPADIEAVRERLKDYDVNVVLMLRDVADFVDSVYAQRLKGGFEGTVDDFIAQNWGNLHWRNLAQRWGRVFGRRNMTILDFGELRNGNLVDNFVSKTFGINLPGETFPSDVANPALPYYAAQMIREVNASDIPNAVKIQFRIHVRDFFGEHGAKGAFRKAKFLSDDSRTILRQYCEWPAMNK